MVTIPSLLKNEVRRPTDRKETAFQPVRQVTFDGAIIGGSPSGFPQHFHEPDLSIVSHSPPFPPYCPVVPPRRPSSSLPTCRLRTCRPPSPAQHHRSDAFFSCCTSTVQYLRGPLIDSALVHDFQGVKIHHLGGCSHLQYCRPIPFRTFPRRCTLSGRGTSKTLMRLLL
jgi:hypothetical protein